MPKRCMKKLILFDMDLTLLDTNKGGVLAYSKALKSFNLKPPEKTRLKKYFGLTGREIIHTFYPRLTQKKCIEIDKRVQYIMISEGYKLAKSYPGVKQTLKKLGKKYELGLVSNASHERIIKYLETTKIDINLFDVIIGYNDVKNSKPSPDEIFKAEKLAKAKAEYLVGDSIYDMIAAKKAKTKSIGVLTGNTSSKELKKYGAWKVIKSVKDLSSII